LKVVVLLFALSKYFLLNILNYAIYIDISVADIILT